ncbi:MAG: hypothetical protein M0017_05620 [Desulfobacteraceae bacterium]|nr:hypothetical protein [Desulfobacteraceae bacterium]
MSPRMASQRQIVDVLLARYGTTFAEELSIPLARSTPSPLFRLLCASLLFSARISARIATAAARALAVQGWTTAAKMAAATWAERTRVLNRSGYARYDERTSRMLGETAGLLLARYGGDLRRLRDAAGREPARERQLLMEFKGIGEVGADIFFREAQVVWGEWYPFVDPKARKGAAELGLPAAGPVELVALVSAADFPRLLAALVRVQLAHGQEEVLAASDC